MRYLCPTQKIRPLNDMVWNIFVREFQDCSRPFDVSSDGINYMLVREDGIETRELFRLLFLKMGDMQIRRTLNVMETGGTNSQ